MCVCVCVCVQEVAELKEEDLPSSAGVATDPPIVATAELPTHIFDANAVTELLIMPAPEGLAELSTPTSVNTVDAPESTGLPTPASCVGDDLSQILCETHSNEWEIPNLLTIYSSYSQVLITCVMC